MIKAHKRSGSVSSVIRDGTLFDYFMVVGIPPDLQPGQPEVPKVLYQFPPIEGPPFDIIPFCFPEGAKAQVLKKTASFSDLNKVLFGQLSALEKSSNSFIFLITADTDIFYGVCVTNDELLESAPSFYPAADKRFSMAAVSKATSRVYCFITRFPFFKIHYAVLYNLLARERLFKIEEATTSFENNMKTPSEVALSPKKDKDKENDAILLLKTYYTHPVPRAGEHIIFKFPGDTNELDFQYMAGDEDSLVAEWCFPSCYSILPLDKIITLLTCCLLERHVVIVCRNIGVLTSIVLSIVPLISPFVWQGPLIPVLPEPLYEYLQAPVPYVVGVLKLSKEFGKDLDALIIDVDNDTMSLPNGGIPPLPNWKQLVLNLKALHTFLYTKTYHDPYKTTEEQSATVHKILTEIRQQTYLILDAIVPHVDPNSDVDIERQKETLVEWVPKKFREFYKQLCITQHFTMYMEDIVNNFKQEKKTTENLVDQFSQKIRAHEVERADALAKIEEYTRKVKDLTDKIAVLKEQQRTIVMLASRKRRLVTNSLELLSKSYNSIKKT